MPVAFAVNWLIYRFLLLPLIRRAPNQDALDGDVVLVTFGLLFVFQGLEQVYWGGNVRGYCYLSFRRAIPRRDPRGEPAAGVPRRLRPRRRCSWCCARPASAARCAQSPSIRSPPSLIGIDVRNFSALAFALGGALVAISGVLVSTFISFSASIGVDYTLKALIVVIIAGVGRMAGALAAGLLLGVVEQVGGYLVDPGLTLAINFDLFMLVLALRPTGLFARA